MSATGMKTNIASIPITLNNIAIEITEQRIPTTIFKTKPVIANDAENIKPMIFKPMDNKQIANKQERTVNIHITPFILFIGYNYYMMNENEHYENDCEIFLSFRTYCGNIGRIIP